MSYRRAVPEKSESMLSMMIFIGRRRPTVVRTTRLLERTSPVWLIPFGRRNCCLRRTDAHTPSRLHQLTISAFRIARPGLITTLATVAAFNRIRRVDVIARNR
jgi:hypothetical protein